MAKTRWYFATCPRGLEPILAEEIGPWKPAELNERVGGVAFRGDTRCAYGVLLWSRVAGRVLEELVRGKINGVDDLYTVAQRVTWSRLIDPGQTLAIASVGRSTHVENTHFAALRVKDAIVDQLREATGGRPDINLEDPDLQLRLHLAGNVVTLSRDLAGDSLHKRGYRDVMHKSPLNEALAAGLILLSGWDPTRPICDPMCGSGTFLIEAGWIAGDRAPGLRRPMRMQRWKDHDARLWAELLEQAEKRWRLGRSAIPELQGNDQHPVSVRMARKAAEAAEVEIELTEGPAETFRTTANFVVSNPPYGERLHGPEPSWHELGTFLHEHPGMEAWILCGEPSLSRSLRLKTSQRIPVCNGAIDCRWLRYLIRDVL